MSSLARRRPRGTRSRRGCPGSGSMAVCPPRPLPIAHGLPGSSGPGSRVLLRPLAVADADGMDRRQVEDVEAHGRHPRHARGSAVRRSRPRSGGRARTQARKDGPLPVEARRRDGCHRRGEVDGVRARCARPPGGAGGHRAPARLRCRAWRRARRAFSKGRPPALPASDRRPRRRPAARAAGPLPPTRP